MGDQFRPLSMQEVSQLLGLQGDDVATRRLISGQLRFRTDSGNLPSLASVTPFDRVDSGRTFIACAIAGAAWNIATVGTTIAGSRLRNLSDPSPPATVGNVWHNTSLITVQFDQDGQTIGKASNPVSWDNCIGTSERPFVPPVPYIFAGGSTVTATIYNGTAITIAAEIVMHGYYLLG